MPRLFPVFLKLTGRKVVVVGGGRVAAAKLPALVEAEADVVVIAPEVREEVADSGARIERRSFRAEDLDNAWYAVPPATPAATRALPAAPPPPHTLATPRAH